MDAVTNSKPRVSFEFEVEKILGISADGRYQVRWAPAWVSKFHLVGCEHLIQEFLQEQHVTELRVNAELEEQETVGSDFEDGPIENAHVTGENSTVELMPVVEVKQEDLSDMDMDSFALSEYFLVEEDHNDKDTSRSESTEHTYEYELPTIGSTNNENDGLHYSSPEEAFVSKQMNEMDREQGNKHCVAAFPHIDVGNLQDLNGRNKKTSFTTKEYKYKCDICGSAFRSVKGLNLHIGNQHPHADKLEKPHTCHLCEYSCKRPSDLVKHVRKHTKEKPFTCKFCGKTFARKDAVYAHIRTHHKGCQS